MSECIMKKYITKHDPFFKSAITTIKIEIWVMEDGKWKTEAE